MDLHGAESIQDIKGMARIGEKVSKLSSVRTDLIERYKIARASKVEACRKLIVCGKLQLLRDRIDTEADFDPIYGEVPLKEQLRS